MSEVNEVQMLSQYLEITEEEFIRYEDIWNKILEWVYFDSEEVKECLAFYVLKTYLLENKLID